MTATITEQMRALADAPDVNHWSASARDALRAAADQLDAVREIVENYGGWYEYSPEDSWRFERDLREALGMPQYEPED